MIDIVAIVVLITAIILFVWCQRILAQSNAVRDESEDMLRAALDLLKGYDQAIADYKSGNPDRGLDRLGIYRQFFRLTVDRQQVSMGLLQKRK